MSDAATSDESLAERVARLEAEVALLKADREDPIAGLSEEEAVERIAGWLREEFREREEISTIEFSNRRRVPWNYVSLAMGRLMEEGLAREVDPE